MWILASTAASMAFALGAAIVSFFLIRRSRRYLAQVAGNQPGRAIPASALSDRQPETPLTRDVLRAEVRIHDTARELMGQLDSKMSALQALNLMAGDAAQRLEAALDRAERLGLAAHRDTLEELAELPAQDLASANGTIADLSRDSERRSRVDQEHCLRLVLSLARTGRNAPSIADELGMPVGEVEMLLSLHG